MNKIYILSVLLLTLVSCKSPMDACIERAMEDGATYKEAKEMCEDARDESGWRNK